jgi:uncharacterized protein
MEIRRRAEAEALRRELTGPAPSLTLVVGPPGSGKRTVVREAAHGLDVVRYWAAPLTDADHRTLFVERLGVEGLPPRSDWPRIFDRLLALAAERTGTLRIALEELPVLVETRPKLVAELERFWAGVRARGLSVHLVLTGAGGPVFQEMQEGTGPFAGWIGRTVPVLPLTFREVGALFPSYPPRDRMLAWAIFGGLERSLRPLDPEVTLATNVRQAVLAPAAPLLDEGIERLERRLQSVARYATLLRSMSVGREEWGEILAGAPELVSGAQMAPYLSRLQRLGIVSAEASLDARPGSRSRRYRILDPFLWFWHRFVQPNLSDIVDGRGAELWRRRVRPELDAYVRRLFPLACREYLARYARERLPAISRELGGLWGSDHDIELAGTLRTGAALYGRAFWAEGRVPEAADEALQEEIRRTRYGFGREARLRLYFSTDGFSSALLRRAARSDAVRLVSLEAMLGLPASGNND